MASGAQDGMIESVVEPSGVCGSELLCRSVQSQSHLLLMKVLHRVDGGRPRAPTGGGDEGEVLTGQLVEQAMLPRSRHL